MHKRNSEHASNNQISPVVQEAQLPQRFSAMQM